MEEFGEIGSGESMSTNQPMPLTRRERNKYETRQRLLSAARTLFAEKGVTGTTIDDIAEMADVSRATFFNYFQTKDSLVSALHDGHMQKLAVLIDGLLEQDLTTAQRVRLVFEDVTDATRRFRIYLRGVTGELERDLASNQISHERTEQFNEQILRVLEPGIAAGEVRTDFPTEFLAQTVAAVYISSFRYWHQDSDYDITDGFDTTMRFIVESIEPRSVTS